MIVRRSLWRVGLFLLITGTPLAVLGADEGAARLSLSDALRMALERNKQLRYHGLEPVIARQVLEYQRAIYVPNLSSKSSWHTLPGAVAGNAEQDRASEVESTTSLGRKSSLGGESSVGVSALNNPNVLAYDGTPGLYTTRLYVRHDQPLLRGAGKRLANLDITKAAIRTNTAAKALSAHRNLILLDVFRDYAAWFRVSEQLRSQQAIRAKAEEIYNIVREKTEKRQMPITDLNTMKVTMAGQDVAILNLHTARRNRCQALLFTALNEPEEAAVPDYVPATSPKDVMAVFQLPGPTDTLAKAVATDLTLLAQETDVAILEEDCYKAFNDRRPELTLSVQGGVDGYAAGGWSDSTRDLSSRQYDVLLSVALALPITDRAARSKLIELTARKEQLQILIIQRRNEIQHIIAELYRNLEEVQKRRTLNEQIVALSRENLNNEMQRLIAGKSTVLDTVVYQTDLIQAELDLVQTLAEYMNLVGDCYALRGEMELLVDMKQEFTGGR